MDRERKREREKKMERDTHTENASHPVDRGISEEDKVVRSRLKWVTSLPSLPPRAMVMSGRELLPRPGHVWVHGPDAATVCVNVSDT